MLFMKYLKHKQTGLGMMEVLAVLVLISGGLITAAFAYVKNMQNINQSKNLTIASNYVSEMAEMIRGNRPGGESNAYASSGMSGSPPDCSSACNASDLAKYQVLTWLDETPKGLVNATAEITALDSNDTLTIRVRWDNDNSGSTGTNCPPQNANDLDCYQMPISF